MPSFMCTRHLEAVGPCEPVSYPGDTIRAVLDAAAVDHPRLKAYVLDDQGALRRHIAIFLDGRKLTNAGALDAGVSVSSEICLFQALSGG